MSEKQAKTLYSWLAAEHARLHLVAGWPDSPRKAAVIRAIRSSLRALDCAEGEVRFQCVLCWTDRVIEIFPKISNTSVSSRAAKAA